MRFSSVLMAASALALLGSVVPSQSEAQEPIRVAALYALTGGMSSLDARSRELSCVDQINGGRCPRPLELWSSIRAPTSRLRPRRRGSRIQWGRPYFGCRTLLSDGCCPTFQDAGIPFITSGATHPMLPTWVGDHMFMAAFGDGNQSYAIADYAYDTLGHRRVYVWTDNSMDFTAR